MPYRRLPNTDNARLRAMKKALEMADKVQPYELAFSNTTLSQLNNLCPYFDQMLHQQKQAIAIQAAKSKELAAYTKKAKLYVSHFYQVFNFAILRNEIPAAARKFFGLRENDSRTPNLISEKDIVYWGEQILKGEQERLAKMGGNPITNPTAAVVKVRYEQFVEALHYQKILQKSTKYATDKIAELRSDVDSLILNLWNEVEEHFSNFEDEEKRKRASEYGIVYIWRPNERNDQQKSDDTYAEESELFENIQDNRTEYLDEDEFEEKINQEQLQYAISFSGN
ncbi:MAG TPA: hypothetical protein PKG63_04265 [Bacteroidales bacterium]|mgnify:FL=1|nr:hypothetical protein [Bacteroidales bacterium]